MMIPMRIVLQDCQHEGIVGREYIFDDATEAEGEFVLLTDGSVVYRHEQMGELFTNSSRPRFVSCVRAWDRYLTDVRAVRGEAAQLKVVDELRQALKREGDLRPGSFWEEILFQAECGQL